jgi:mono/diheme cytochrome c family protein
MRKTWVKRTLVGVGAMVALGLVSIFAVAAYAAATWDRKYDLPVPKVATSQDPAVLARGGYLVRGPAHCVNCHIGSYDALARAAKGEAVPLSGGLTFEAGPLGKIFSANLTPDVETGIGRYSNGQLARLLRYAVRPDGHATVQPLMPYDKMSDEDVAAIISYLRAQPPVRNAVPEGEWTAVGKTVKALAPTFKPRTEVHPPAVGAAEAPTRERGEYLARSVANCVGCHTPRNPLTFAATGPEFSGGSELPPDPAPGADPTMWLRSPNLTPHPTGSLAKFPDRDTFIARFRLGGRQHAGSPMPWEAFRRMSDADLGALYEFFRSLPPAPGPTGNPEFKKS